MPQQFIPKGHPTSRQSATPCAPLLVSIDDAAGSLAVGRSTVTRLIRRGDLDALKIGSRTLISWKALEAFIASRSRAAATTGVRP